MHPKLDNSHPTLIALADGSTISSSEFNPALHTAAVGGVGTALAASEVARLQVLATNGMGRAPQLVTLAKAWTDATAALKTATDKGAAATVAEMRTALNAFYAAEDALFGSTWL